VGGKTSNITSGLMKTKKTMLVGNVSKSMEKEIKRRLKEKKEKKG